MGWEQVPDMFYFLFLFDFFLMGTHYIFLSEANMFIFSLNETSSHHG